MWEHLLQFHHAGRFIRLWGNYHIVLKDARYVREHLWTAKAVATGEVKPFFKGLEPVEAVVIRHRETGQDILLVHGHQVDSPNVSWASRPLRGTSANRTAHVSPAKGPSARSGTRYDTELPSSFRRLPWGDTTRTWNRCSESMPQSCRLISSNLQVHSLLSARVTPLTCLHHFRDLDGLEVDLIIELADGRLLAIEVKSSTSITEAAWTNLIRFRDRFPDRNITGACLHTGTQTAVVGGWLYILPVTALWQH